MIYKLVACYCTPLKELSIDCLLICCHVLTSTKDQEILIRPQSTIVAKLGKEEPTSHLEASGEETWPT